MNSVYEAEDYDQIFQAGFDEGVDWVFNEIDKALKDVAMTHDERRGAIILHRWLCRQHLEGDNGTC